LCSLADCDNIAFRFIAEDIINQYKQEKNYSFVHQVLLQKPDVTLVIRNLLDEDIINKLAKKFPKTKLKSLSNYVCLPKVLSPKSLVAQMTVDHG